MSPIRYVRDGLKLVRIDVPREPPPRPDAPPPLPLLSGEVLELARTVRGLAARLRYDAWRARQVARLQASRKPRAAPDKSSEVPAEDVLKARKLAGISQRDLAAELGLTRSTLAEAERGVRHVPERLGDWAAGVLRAQGETPCETGSSASSPAAS